MDKADKIFVAGHNGLVGSAVVGRLQSEGFTNLVLRNRSELDLLDGCAVRDFFAAESPDYVIDSAAKVGGVKAKMSSPAEFLYENLQMQNNLIWAAKERGVKKFLFLGSASAYPSECPQPIREEFLMMGKLDPMNEAYAHAKIAGIKLCEYIYQEFGMSFISCMPTNIFGEGDNFDPGTSHVIPALVYRIHRAKIDNSPQVTIWGSGENRREFLHVDDLADAVVWLLVNYNEMQFVNVGTGEDIAIAELAQVIKNVIGFQGRLVFDPTKPDGVPKRLLDVSRLRSTGWHHKVVLEEGIERTYRWYLANIEDRRK